MIKFPKAQWRFGNNFAHRTSSMAADKRTGWNAWQLKTYTLWLGLNCATSVCCAAAYARYDLVFGWVANISKPSQLKCLFNCHTFQYTRGASVIDDVYWVVHLRYVVKWSEIHFKNEPIGSFRKWCRVVARQPDYCLISLAAFQLRLHLFGTIAIVVVECYFNPIRLLFA